MVNDSNRQSFGHGIACDGDRILVTTSGSVSAKGYVFGGAMGLDCDENGQSDTCDLLTGDLTEADANGIPDQCQLSGDLNFDGAVDDLDLGTLVSAWGAAGTIADLNGDGVVNGADLGILLAAWTT